MNIKRSSLTAFFILLTLSIGLVSANSPLTVKAQDNALSQNGVGAAEQETEQGQSSTQDNQIVSGDSSIASGNNLLCQDEDNSKGIKAMLPNALRSCLLDEPSRQLPNIGRNVLTIDVASFRTSSDITVTDESDGSSDTFRVFLDVVRQYVIPVGHHYSIEVDSFDPEAEIGILGDCEQGPDPWSCKGVMQSQPQLVVIRVLGT